MLKDRKMANRTLNSSELDRVGPELKRTEGTWHQQQVGLQRWTFFRPSAAYASAVSRDAEDVEYSETEEVRSILTMPGMPDGISSIACDQKKVG